MTAGSVLLGARRVNQLNGQTTAIANFPASILGARSSTLTLSASYQTVLNITGRGALNFVALLNGNMSGVVGLRVTIDGRQIYAYSASTTNAYGICAVGTVVPTAVTNIGSLVPQQVLFTTSALVEAFFNTGGGGTPSVYLNYEVDV